MESTTEESMVRQLVAEVLESAVNLALAYEPMAQERLNDHLGRVLRVKTTSPDWMFFIAICEDGIQLYSHYEEEVAARITLPTSIMTQFVLGRDETRLTDLDEVRCSGDLAFLNDILDVAQQFSILSVVKRVLNNWLPEFQGFAGLIEALKKNDPAWIVRLEHLPQLANETLMTVRNQGELLNQQAKELVAIKRQLMADRRTNRISTVIGFCLIVVAFMAHNGYLQMPAIKNISLDTLILLILSLVILVPRLISGR